MKIFMLLFLVSCVSSDQDAKFVEVATKGGYCSLYKYVDTVERITCYQSCDGISCVRE